MPAGPTIGAGYLRIGCCMVGCFMFEGAVEHCDFARPQPLRGAMWVVPAPTGLSGD